ncbi:MAG: IS1595 family transposase, partial [Spirochaetia bacterium]|nr:IS1595 family transposase [Spirochaetia bacterium]
MMEFDRKFPDEDACENHLFQLKWPSGFCCSNCGGKKYYKLKGKSLKRRRLLQCASRDCKKQVSLTGKTMFHGSKIPLQKWYIAIFLMTQTKKGISGVLLSKQIHVSESTALLMQYKIRKKMESDMVKYKIGGPDFLVLAEEFKVGGKTSSNQKVLALLEIQANQKQKRIRLIPIPDKQNTSVELNLIPLIAQGSTLCTNAKKNYSKISIRNFKQLDYAGVIGRHEICNFQSTRKLEINIINFKKWYLGLHHFFALTNTGYYCNEFSYRFNRRREE